MEYNPYIKTALKRKSVSVPMRELINLNIFDLDKSVIDIGCGNNTDVQFLNYLGVNALGYDKYNPKYDNSELLHNRYDIVTCFYVFNVIKDIKEHQKLINDLKKLGEEVYICVRSDIKAVKDTWEYNEYHDCWRTSTSSYQRFYTERTIHKYFGKVEYIMTNSSLKLFKLTNYI